jgi:hypothetical protein
MDLKSYRQAIIGGTKWLMSQQQQDGSFRPVDHGLATCHKVPYALALMGEGDRAARLCAWITEQLMDDEGDLTRLYPRLGFMARYYEYPNAWLVAGAQKLGLFGLSWPAVGLLTALQHPKTGGFLSAGPSAGLHDEQDVLTTATCGLACLHMGQGDAALRAGEFLQYVLEAQPRSNALYMVTAAGGKLVQTGYGEADELHYCLHVGRPSQFLAVPAMAILFLTKLADAVGDAEWRKVARSYIAFTESAPDQAESIRTGFLGWAAAELYAASGIQGYRDMAGRIADGLLGQQLENGSWLQASMSADLDSDVVDGTAENVIVLKSITRALALGA